MLVRPGTSDLAVVGSTFADVAGAGLVDEYGLAGLHVEGRFADVGAHIGSVTVAVLLDNPGATAVCVEPVPENADVLRRNLQANGLADRAEVVEAAFGATAVHYGFSGDEVAVTNRFIGNLNIPARVESVARVREATLDDVLPAEALKTDCEGGEWALLADPRIAQVPTVLGEYHGRPGPEGVLAALGATHDVTFSDAGGWAGNFRAVAR